jgi:hypothetical protein
MQYTVELVDGYLATGSGGIQGVEPLLHPRQSKHDKRTYAAD